MFVFVAHAEADLAAADDLKAFLKSRGLVVETEAGAQGFRHLQKSDVVVALWSQKSAFGTHRMQLEKRMLDAWADDRLVLVKLDQAFLPVGMRDLPAIDAGFESARKLSIWPQVERTVRDAMNAALVATQPPAVQPVPPPAASGLGAPPRERLVNRVDDAPNSRAEEMPAKKGGGGQMAFLGSLAVAGVSAWALVSHSDAVLHLPPVTAAIGLGGGGMEIPIFWLATGGLAFVGGLILVAMVSTLVAGRAKSRRRTKAAPRRKRSAARSRPAREAQGAANTRPSEALAPDTQDAVFISYAHADNAQVDPVVKVVEASGRAVWIDKGGIQAGEGWAGEIVKGIKSSKGVMVMCSPRAFESDHIKREVYLADRYKKPMLPVFIVEAKPPEDFEYFFASVQWLELFKLPEADRAAAIGKALAAV